LYICTLLFQSVKDLEEENQLLKEEIDILRQSTVIHFVFFHSPPLLSPLFTVTAT